MSSCLSGSSSGAYALDLDIVKSAFTSIRTLHTSSASSTPSESSNSLLTICTRKPRTARKRLNQTYDEAVALLSSAYPNIFHTKNLTKTRKFIKQRDSFLDEAPELLLPFRGIDNSAFLLHQPIQEKPSFQIQTKIANFCEKSCQSPGEVDFHESSLEFCDGYEEDFDAKSIFDEDMEEGIDSIMGNLSVDTGMVDEFSDASCSSVRENTRCENPIPMGPGFGRKYDFGFGMKIDGAVRALRHVDDGNCLGSPIVDVRQISPKFHKTPVLTKKKKKKKKVEKSTVESKDKESSKDNSPPKPNSRLLLKLNFKEVLNAWSDRGSLFLDEIPGDDVSARLAHIDLFLEGGVREAGVLRYKEKRHTRLFSKKIIYQVKKANADRRSRTKTIALFGHLRIPECTSYDGSKERLYAKLPFGIWKRDRGTETRYYFEPLKRFHCKPVAYSQTALFRSGEMLMQSSLPSSNGAALHFSSDHGKEDTLCDWRPGTEIWQMCSNCDKYPHGHCKKAEPIIEEKENANTPSSLNFPRSYAQPPNLSTISESCIPNFVYRRRKLRGNLLTSFSSQSPVNAKKSADSDSRSFTSFDAPSVAAKEQHVVFQVEHESHTVGAPIKASLSCVKEPCILKSQSINGCSVGEGHVSGAAIKNGRRKILEVDSANDSCSSSESNMELVSASMMTEVDDTGECSSSSVMVMEVKGEDLSENDLCISILRCQGLVEVLPTKNDDSAEHAGPSSGSSCSRSCKICGHTDTTLNMLICDNCEDAFHVSCLNPRMKKIPDDEWFCYSCLKKKCKIPMETGTRRSLSIACEMGRCRNTLAKDDLNPIASMLRDTESYTMGVRVGKGFQAEVPDWSGPMINDVDAIGEPVEMNPSECVTSHERNFNKPYTPNSIGNWIQCREVIDGIGEGINGTICGKWRRAPLCEVQTDDWDCFRSVLWDPFHADCAVPQELETDQVIKQLKYVQMLRPQLAAKRRKSDHRKKK